MGAHDGLRSRCAHERKRAALRDIVTSSTGVANPVCDSGDRIERIADGDEWIQSQRHWWCRVEKTDSLSPPIVWAAVTNAPTIVSNRYQVTLNKTNETQFFRLIKP